MALKYRVFWEALIVSIFIFGLGLLFGVFLEDYRNQQVEDNYLSSEIDLLDVNLMSSLIQGSDVDCDLLVQKNIEFADEIYEDAKKLGEYEEANQITSQIIEKHKKYDILRTIFWKNSIDIKEKCGQRFNTLVYLYDYDSQDANEKSKQFVFSKALSEIKNELGSEVIVIPIAKNLDLDSLDLMIAKYNLSSASIILNEKEVYSEVSQVEELRVKIQSERNSIVLN